VVMPANHIPGCNQDSYAMANHGSYRYHDARFNLVTYQELANQRQEPPF